MWLSRHDALSKQHLMLMWLSWRDALNKQHSALFVAKADESYARSQEAHVLTKDDNKV